MQTVNELLPNRLNAEPAIFRGCSLTELMSLVLISGITWVPLSIAICGLLGYMMMGVGMGLLAVMASVVIGGTLLQRLKRGKPIGFYQLRLRLWLDDIGICRVPVIREGRVWSVGRLHRKEPH